MALLLGTARVDITPPWPVPLAGFASRAGQEPASQVARPLRLRVLGFGRGSPGELAAVLVCADLIWWGEPLATTLRTAIAARHRIPRSAVFLHATHNHSGPQTGHGFTALLGEPDQRYLDHLGGRTLDAVAEAAATLRPVTVERAYGESAIGVNRRGSLDAGTGLRPDPYGPVDRQVTVLRFRGGAGRTEALLVHFACHPVIAAANQVSSDFTGAAMDELERDLPAGSVAAYAQGCCGDVNPAVYDNHGFRPGDETDVTAYGDRLATAVRAALAGGVTPLGPPDLASRETTVRLPLGPVPDEQSLRALRDVPGVDGQWARLLLAAPERRRPSAELRLTALRLTADLVLLGFAAEPTTGYGRYLKASGALPLGYTNGMLGYLVTAAEAVAGGYEAAGAPRYFGMPAPLGPDAERHARDGIDRLLADLPIAVNPD